MYRVEVQPKINLLISLFYKVGIWDESYVESSVWRTILKLFLSIYFTSYILSLIVGGIVSDVIEESIPLILAGTLACVIWVKFHFMIYKKSEILHLLNEVCVYTIRDRKSISKANEKLRNITKFITVLVSTSVITGFYCLTFSPLYTRKLFFNIAFPFDYKSSETAFWLAYTYMTTVYVLVVIGMLFNVFLWYFMYSLALRHRLLEHQITSMGRCSDHENVSLVDKSGFFNQDLIAVIRIHEKTKE